MLQKKNDSFLTFSDGVLCSLEVTRGRIIEDAAPAIIPAQEMVVGYGRFYSAQQIGVAITMTLSVPDETKLEREQFVEYRDFRNGAVNIYRIEQIQRKPDTKPASFLLSLSEVKTTFEDKRQAENRLGAMA